MQPTQEGAERLSLIFEHCYENNPKLIRRNKNGPVNGGRPSLNNWSYLISEARGEKSRGYVEGLKRIRDADLKRQISFDQAERIAPWLWVPGSENLDYIQKQPANSFDLAELQEETKLYFTPEEVWAVYIGKLDPCSTEQMVNILTGGSLEGLSPLAERFEQLRRTRQNSYGELCEAIGLSRADVKRIRKVLAFNGWGLDFETGLYLARYLESYSKRDGTAEKEFAELHRASVGFHSKELNGASA